MKLFSPYPTASTSNRIQTSLHDTDGPENLQYCTALVGFFRLFVEHLFQTPESYSCQQSGKQISINRSKLRTSHHEVKPTMAFKINHISLYNK
jgi:hypothetical protein